LKTGYYLIVPVLLCTISWKLFLTSAQKRTTLCLNSSMLQFQKIYVSLILIKNTEVATGYIHLLVVLSSVISFKITSQVNNKSWGWVILQILHEINVSSTKTIVQWLYSYLSQKHYFLHMKQAKHVICTNVWRKYL